MQNFAYVWHTFAIRLPGIFMQFPADTDIPQTPRHPTHNVAHTHHSKPTRPHTAPRSPQCAAVPPPSTSKSYTHLCCTSQAITALTHTDVQAQLGHPNVTHRIRLVPRHRPHTTHTPKTTGRPNTQRMPPFKSFDHMMRRKSICHFLAKAGDRPGM